MSTIALSPAFGLPLTGLRAYRARMEPSRPRIPELDSIRGLAALTVLVTHLTHFWALNGREGQVVSTLAYDCSGGNTVISGTRIEMGSPTTPTTTGGQR